MTLPSIWANAVGIHAGDEVEILLSEDCLRVFPKKVLGSEGSPPEKEVAVPGQAPRHP
ncbi:MAG: AbrB/MazE/SpoVT family DNA-binding domain-containing protein [Thaumarchaeota archaeon]|nr:AbrB/MazE/SpoVT family DNA-binding domain-containing protein [Nitrososphaerota archaeon]